MRSRFLLMTTAWITACTAVPQMGLAQSAVINQQVQSGVDAWKAGDFDMAVRAWMPVANSGNADAQFNMGQAYKLGRGVTTSLADAENWYRRAAEQGHLQAEDNLGLILFTMGKREAAMPYVRRSAARGEARSQFLLGTAHYNGDLAAKDWPRAYALITRASETGLSLAKSRITELDRLIPQNQRSEGLAMLPEMRKAEEAARLAALPTAEAPVPPSDEQTRPAPRAAVAPPAPVQIVELPPSRLNANLDAAADPIMVAPTPLPAPAPAPAPRPAPGVTFTPQPVTPPVTTPKPAAQPTQPPARPRAAATPAPTPAKPAPQPAAAVSRWRAQLGAFSVPQNARTMWKTMSGKYPELRRHSPQYVTGSSGRLTRLMVGGFQSQSQAAALCATLRGAGGTCLVTSD